MSFNDIYYTAALIEYISRETRNHRFDVAARIGEDGIRRLIQVAPENHCLSFAQVSEEVIEDYDIPEGTFDTISNCQYKVPSHLSIGKVYARLVEDVGEGDGAASLYEIMTSPFSDELSNFNTSLYFAPRSEVAYYYKNQ